MQEDVEDEFARLLALEIGRTIDLEVKKAIGMIPIELRYKQKLYIAYTGLDGLERADIVHAHELIAIKRRKTRSIAFTKKFPFIEFDLLYFTDVVLNTGTDCYPLFKHIYALESPNLMARKFGIDYNCNLASELLKDHLENGDR